MYQNRRKIEHLYNKLPDPTKEHLDQAIGSIISTKKKNGKVVVATGSGPNLHEGVTTLIAELIHKGLVDGVTTSSAVVAHEMAGVLDEVKRVDGKNLSFSADILPYGDIFLDFISYPQQTIEGKKMRRWIVDNITPVKKVKLNK